MIKKIISGAQTGADQAGLVAAKALGLKTGGTVPKGRRTQGGPLTNNQMKRWNLFEHASANYAPRTASNVKMSDGTVIFGDLNSPGSKLTKKLCRTIRRPVIENPQTHQELCDWLIENNIQILNVAGNREETNPGIFNRVTEFLIDALSNWRNF